MARDRGWKARELTDDEGHRELMKYRADITPAMDCSSYPTMLCTIVEYAGDATGQPSPELRAELASFEVVLKGAVEQANAGIFVSAKVAGLAPQAEYYVYACDEQATRTLIEALPGPTREVKIERDPRWSVYFHEIVPAR
jgi:hypothetical protein